MTQDFTDKSIENRNRIVQANMGLVYTVAKRTSQRHNRDDAIGEGMIALVRAVETYDPHCGTQFSTYAVHLIRNAMLMMHRTNTNQRKRVQGLAIRTVASDQEQTTNTDEPVDVARLLERTKLNERQSQVIRYRYGIGCERLTLAETSVLMGLSVARIQQIEMQALGLLRSQIQ